MPREEAIRVEGTVVEVLPNNLFRVELPNGHRFMAHTSGRMRLNFVRLVMGDKVMVEMSPYDLSKGLIILNEETKQ
ncbi:MAG TPA: translation initiation factor IF-1 [Candidatus Kapabacteria bacterium]|nr:translation initiation factor IF-1 [Candidatus Kapabacteria bacterium]